tara:strand:- start:744 stop:1448 length:705 start_codon:yes stop_codon:yes gene_type:complete
MRTRQSIMKNDYYLGKDSDSESDNEKDKVSAKDKYWNGDSEKLEVKEIDNHIYFYSKVCKKSAQEVNMKLREVEKEILEKYRGHKSHQEYIYLHINSFGGSVFSAFSIIDTIKSLKVPVVSIVEGAAASAGTLISIVCDYRIIFKTSYMLIHQLSSGCWGQMDKLEEEMENLRELMTQIKNVYKNHSRIPHEELDEILKHDYWWNADVCMSKGLVDEVRESDRSYSFRKDQLDI